MKSRTHHQDKYQSDIRNNQEINKINAEYIQCMHTESLCVLNVCLYSFKVFHRQNIEVSYLYISCGIKKNISLHH